MGGAGGMEWVRPQPGRVPWRLLWEPSWIPGPGPAGLVPHLYISVGSSTPLWSPDPRPVPPSPRLRQGEAWRGAAWRWHHPEKLAPPRSHSLACRCTGTCAVFQVCLGTVTCGRIGKREAGHFRMHQWPTPLALTPLDFRARARSHHPPKDTTPHLPGV